jgi:hypothetical protein
MDKPRLLIMNNVQPVWIFRIFQPVLFLAVLFLLLVGLVLDNTFGFGTVQGPRVCTYTNDWMLWCNCDKIGLPRQGSIECMANVVKQRMTSC